MANDSTMKWFNHDINAHDDIKIKKLLKKFGFSATGIYWFIVELLCTKGGRLEFDEAVDEVTLVDGLTEEEVRVIINQLVNLGLLFLEGSLLGSHRADNEIKKYQKSHENAVIRGQKGGTATQERLKNNSRASQELLDSNSRATQEQLESNSSATKANSIQFNTNINPPLLPKGNIPPLGETDTKNKKFSKPSIDEIKAYCSESGHHINAEAFWDFYESKGWKVGKNPMKDWKAAVRNWERGGHFLKVASETTEKKPATEFEYTPEQIAASKKSEEEARALWRRDHGITN